MPYSRGDFWGTPAPIYRGVGQIEPSLPSGQLTLAETLSIVVYRSMMATALVTLLVAEKVGGRLAEAFGAELDAVDWQR